MKTVPSVPKTGSDSGGWSSVKDQAGWPARVMAINLPLTVQVSRWPLSPRATDALTKSTIDPREERLVARSFHIFPAAFGFWRSRCGLCRRSGSRGAVVPGVGLKSRAAPLRFAGGWVVSSPDRGAEGRVMPGRQYVGLPPKA